MRERFGLLKATLFLAVFAITFSLSYTRGQNPEGPLAMQLVPSYGVVPDFHLVEASRDPLSRENLRGQIWVASFLFTSCSGTCPAMANRNRLLQSVMPEGVKLISISVDPERDSPEVLFKWGQRYGRDPQKWLLATGDFLRIRKLMIEGFHLQGDDPFNHSNGFALVDGRSFLRGYYDSLKEEDMSRLIRDSNLLLAEAKLLPTRKQFLVPQGTPGI